jgi:hypothetical protein
MEYSADSINHWHCSPSEELSIVYDEPNKKKPYEVFKEKLEAKIEKKHQVF